MKLSEAIRIGVAQTKHNQGSTFYEYVDGEWYTDTFGAAVLGYQTEQPDMYFIRMLETVPGIKECYGEILRRNPSESREQIADWVEHQGY